MQNSHGLKMPLRFVQLWFWTWEWTSDIPTISKTISWQEEMSQIDKTYSKQTHQKKFFFSHTE